MVDHLRTLAGFCAGVVVGGVLFFVWRERRPDDRLRGYKGGKQ